MIHTQKIEYQDGAEVLEGYSAYNKNLPGKRPVVIVVHDWSGCNDFARQKAEKLAELGYLGFAIDMYGKGKVGTTIEEKSALMQPLKDNRTLLRQRILAGFEMAKTLAMADTAKIGAIGFCFGGLCALDLARSGAEVKGVVSFHGLLDAPTDLANKAIKAKILALHGHDDPLANPAAVNAFQTEMTKAQVDWQTHVYGNIQHAFTNPAAHDKVHGLVYNELAAERSWQTMKDFFKEIFA